MKFGEFLRGRTILDNGYRDVTPRVSVVMPTYCRHAEGLLTRCLDSVLAQTLTQFEFIIVDDGSVDGTEGVVRDYAARDPRIVYVRHAVNSGLPAVRTDEGILLARAPYVSFIFDDNVWAPDALQSMWKIMTENPVDIVYANIELARHETGPPLVGKWPLTLELLPHINTIPNGGVLCRRRFFETYGLYDPHLVLRRICDFDLWLRAARLGATFRHLDRCVGTEYGQVSPASLGRTVEWDFKVAYAYLACERRLPARVAALRPERIADYDVFDSEAVLPYLRDAGEWSSLEQCVYQPYFTIHSQYSYEPPIIHNHSYEAPAAGFALNAQFPVNRERRRVLLVSNRFSRVVREWRDALAAHAGAIVVSCSEWGLSSFLPSEIDLVVLFDCTAPFVRTWIQRFHDSDVPIIYVVTHGLDEANSVAALRPVDFGSHPAVHESLAAALYFALPGVPWSAEQQQAARLLVALADQVVWLGARGRPTDAISERMMQLEWIANAVPEAAAAENTHGAIYLADPGAWPADVIAGCEQWLRRTAPEVQWTVYVYPDSEWPAALASYRERCAFRFTHDTLPILAESLRDTCLVVPEPLLSLYAPYHRSLMEEDLARNGGALVSLSGTDVPPGDAVSAATFQTVVRTSRARVTQLGQASRPDARPLYLASIGLAVLLKKRVERLRPMENQRPLKAATLLNSPMLSGSEMFGLLCAKQLARLGIEVMVCTPVRHGYGPDVDGREIDAWLQQRGLPPAIRADYGMGSSCFAVAESEAYAHAVRFRRWLDERDVDVVLCAALITEPLIALSDDRLVYAALFSPWGYDLERVMAFRSRTSGVCSDSEWGRKIWSRWFAPPVARIPSEVEACRFAALRSTIPASPIRIAVAGTMQPRKRQIAAIRALEQLLHDGFDVTMNVYGYELPMMADYVAQAKSLAGEGVLRGRVRFHGLVEDFRQVVEENHLLLMPSIDESLPLTLLETMAGGIVPVACPAGGVAELVREGETGFLADGFSVDAISAALRRAVTQRDRWPQLIARGRSVLVSEHSEAIAAYRLLEFMVRGAEIATSAGSQLFRADERGPRFSRVRVGRTLVQCFSPFATDANRTLVIGPDATRTALRYSMDASRDQLCGLQFSVGTYYTSPQGTVRLSIRSHGSRKTLREVSFDLHAIVDNGWFKIGFEPIAQSANQRFDVTVSVRLTVGRLAFYEMAPRGQSNGMRLSARVSRGLRRRLKMPVSRARPAFFPIYAA